MPRYAYDRLTALDTSFLILERPNAYMHVASTMVFEAGPLRTPSGGIDADAIKRHVAAALPRIPRYRERLEWPPLIGNPVWVDDARFNLDFHVRHTALPKPGDDAQLKRLSARIMQQHLDRARPLWELWIVEGLEGDRFALISKTHHCMIDGISGVDIMRVLLSQEPGVGPEEIPGFIPRPEPGAAELLASELWRWARLPFDAVQGVRSLLEEAVDLRRDLSTRLRAIGDTIAPTVWSASETPLNGDIGPHRRFDWWRMPIEDVKAARRALGGSLNDIVLAVVAGAVRRFLMRRQVNPALIDFRIMAPVSVRANEERGTLGNRVSAWIVDLPVGEPDPVRRLGLVRQRTEALKQSKQAVGAEVLTQVAEWTPSTLLALAGRNVTRMLPFNMVVTNVPGPQQPMYLLGAHMLAAYPQVPIMNTLGLGVALLSCDGALCWGFNADWDLVPDLADFVGCVRESFDELRAAASLPAAGYTNGHDTASPEHAG